RNAPLLCHRSRSDLQGCCRYDDIAAFGGRANRFELCSDRAFRELAPHLGGRRGRRHRRRRAGRPLTYFGTDRREQEAEAPDPVAEARRYTQTDLLAECSQLPRQRDERLNITARSDCRQQHTHGSSSVSERPALSRVSLALDAVYPPAEKII